MREIKFRAWDKKLKTFHFSCLNCLVNDNGFLFEGDGSAHADFFEFGCNYEVLNIEQYTGLKDINGKEIYEGDIVNKQVSESIMFGEKQTFNRCWIVEYNNSTGSFIVSDQINSERKFDFDFSDYNNCPIVYITESKSFKPKIIGNIHENKELLR